MTPSSGEPTGTSLGRRDVVVIGASAGGVEALRTVVAGLPAHFPAAVLVVLHVPTHGTSALPEILGRAGPLPARHAGQDSALEPGVVLVAPPDHHLVLRDGVARITRGPSENGHRPSIDVLFRSAGSARGPQVVGVVLSGVLDDGTAGMAAIHRHGGTLVVQDPDDAMYPGMPSSVLAQVPVDHVLPARDIGRLLEKLCTESIELARPATDPGTEAETEMALMQNMPLPDDEHPGTPSPYACPDCSGVLYEIGDGDLIRYRCRVGHAWSAESLLGVQADNIDSALWMALRTLEEKAALARQLAARAQARGSRYTPRRYHEQAAAADEAANVIRSMLQRPQLDPTAGGPG